MVARTPLLLLVVGALVVGATLVGTPAASARTTYQTDPFRNIGLPSRVWGPACTNHPMRHRCERIMVRGLNHAREVMGQPSYNLPARFGALRAREQLLVLSNLDRKLYQLGAIAGLNPTLNATAERGADAGSDPIFVAVAGEQMVRGTSNWAGGLRSPLASYFLWMYDDASEGWMHRHAVLMGKGGKDNLLIMGAGSSPEAGGMPDWTMILESFAPSTSIQLVPTVTALVLPTSTTASGVRLFGFGFLHVRQVTFGGVSASFTRTSLFTINAIPPAHAPGSVHVQVVTLGGTSAETAAAVYTY
jgi:hypothetical protein